MEALLRNLRHAFRTVRKRPLFALVAIGSIAVGISANATIVSLVNALLVRPLPGIHGIERIVEIGRTDRGRGFDTLSYPELLDLQDQAQPLENVVGWQLLPMSLAVGGEAHQVMGMLVSHAYFTTLGVRAARGRFFSPEDGVPADPWPAIRSPSYGQTCGFEQPGRELSSDLAAGLATC